MIEFDCPECGEPMEVRDRMAGRKVRCVECDGPVIVPDDDDDVPRRRRRPLQSDDDGLSGTEFLLFGLACLAVPGVNVWVTSILYYVWKAKRPKRANQINLLGFAVFGIHLACFCLFMIFFGPLARR